MLVAVEKIGKLKTENLYDTMFTLLALLVCEIYPSVPCELGLDSFARTVLSCMVLICLEVGAWVHGVPRTEGLQDKK